MPPRNIRVAPRGVAAILPPRNIHVAPPGVAAILPPRRYRDEGLCDQVCKNLLGRATHRGRTEAEVTALGDVATPRPLDARLAVERLETCVVGLQEDWPAAVRAAGHWFPWLGLVDDVRANVGYTDAETRETLRPDLRAALERCNACDLAVYEAAVRRARVQSVFLDGLS